MSATTVFGQVGTDQSSTHNKRNAVIVFTVIALFALSFFLGRATAPSHVSSTAQTHAQLSPADRAIVANDVATGPVSAKLSPADRAIVAGDVAKTGPLSTEKMSAANRAEIANDVAPVTPISQANATSCIAGRPC